MASSHLASTTFCWLPPLSVLTACCVAGCGSRVARRPAFAQPPSRSSRAVSQPGPPSGVRRQCDQRDVVRNRRLQAQPFLPAVLGQEGQPARMSLRGWGRSVLPFEPDLAPCVGIEAEENASQFGPARPIKPARPSTSPRCRSKPMSCDDAGLGESPHLQDPFLPGGAARAWGNSWVMLRPTISETSLSTRELAARPAPTSSPVAQARRSSSHSRSTSPRLCEM